MSASIAPDNLSVGITLASRVAPSPVPTSRPIENAGALAADTDSSKHRAFGRKISDGNKAEPGTRPPGKDPSVLPQSLFDAALIASEYKPQTHQEFEPAQPAEVAPSRSEPAAPEIDSAPPSQVVQIASPTKPENSDGRVPLEQDESVARLSA